MRDEGDDIDTDAGDDADDDIMKDGGGEGGALTLDISRVGRQPPGTSVKSTQAVLGQISWFDTILNWNLWNNPSEARHMFWST